MSLVLLAGCPDPKGHGPSDDDAPLDGGPVGDGDGDGDGDGNPPGDGDGPSSDAGERPDPTEPDGGGLTPLPDDIGAALAAVGLTVVGERPSEYAGYRWFDLTITQPMDHEAPDGKTFEQRIMLHHRDSSAPMVLATTGYGNFDVEWLMEPALLLEGNQLMVEHRYFPPSIPEAADWSKLNIRQSADDFHVITKKLKRIYGARWVNTGASKGGMTALFHRRFYPNDLDGTVAYVAPFSFGTPDDRYIPFLAAINPDGCGDDVRALQLRFIQDRAAIGKTLLDNFDTGPSITTPEQAAFFAADTSVWYEWGFWQYYGVEYCETVSKALGDDMEAARLLSSEIVLNDALDVGYAYEYQAMHELGWQGISTAHIDAALAEVQFPPVDRPPPPWGDDWPTYYPDSLRDVADWVAESGDGIMLVYGQYDPWTGGAVDLGKATDSAKFVVPNGTHGAEIGQLPEAERAKALAMLYRWADTSAPDMTSVNEKRARTRPMVEVLRRLHSLGRAPRP